MPNLSRDKSTARNAGRELDLHRAGQEPFAGLSLLGRRGPDGEFRELSQARKLVHERELHKNRFESIPLALKIYSVSDFEELRRGLQECTLRIKRMSGHLQDVISALGPVEIEHRTVSEVASMIDEFDSRNLENKKTRYGENFQCLNSH